MKNFLRIFIGVEFNDTDNLKNSKQFIVVGNHNSHIDTMAIMASLPFSIIDKVHPVAAADYFAKNPLCSFLSRLFINVLLINRKGSDGNGSPIPDMLYHLKKGKSLIIFPEGSRGEPGVLQDFKKGTSIILKEMKDIPFLPAYMCGFEKSLPKGDFLLVPHNSSIRFGAPTFINSSMEINDITGLVKNKILELNN